MQVLKKMEILEKKIADIEMKAQRYEALLSQYEKTHETQKQELRGKSMVIKWLSILLVLISICTIGLSILLFINF